MGLLPYLTTHALDEDYQLATVQRRTTEPGKRPPMGWAGVVIIAVFGLLVITAAVQTSRNAVDEDSERQGLLAQVDARREALGDRRDQIAELTSANNRLESDFLSGQSNNTTLESLSVLRLRTGAVAVKGPGVRVVVDDASDADSARNQVLDSDLQKLANGLWAAGAEAISINGQRLTNLSAIRRAGSAITVNYRSLSRPYRVLAIGNPKTLASRFAETTHGAAWFDLQREVGLKFKMTTEESLRVPAASRLSLRYATRNTETKQ